MSIKLVDITQSSKDTACFVQINETAFPKSERMPFDEIFSFAAKTDTDVMGIYDEEMPVGFAVLLKNQECAYLYYLAVAEEYRGKGYGSKALKEIVRKYDDLQIILDFEEIDETAKNNAQRVRRKNFYLNNGFFETGRYTLLAGNRFEVVCNAGNLREEGFKALLHILHKHRAAFPDVLI